MQWWVPFFVSFYVFPVQLVFMKLWKQVVIGFRNENRVGPTLPCFLFWYQYHLGNSIFFWIKTVLFSGLNPEKSTVLILKKKFPRDKNNNQVNSFYVNASYISENLNWLATRRQCVKPRAKTSFLYIFIEKAWLNEEKKERKGSSSGLSPISDGTGALLTY